MAVVNDRIKERRIQSGLTLLQVAEMLGVKEATVQRYESGEIKNIKHEIILSLSRILNCNPAYLMGWVNNPYEEIKKPDADIGAGLDRELIEMLRSVPAEQLQRVKDFVAGMIAARNESSK